MAHEMQFVRKWPTGWEQYICRECGRLSLWLESEGQVMAIQLVKGQADIDHILADGRSESRRWLDAEARIIKRRQEQQREIIEAYGQPSLLDQDLKAAKAEDELELDELWQDAINSLDFGDEPDSEPEGVS